MWIWLKELDVRTGKLAATPTCEDEVWLILHYCPCCRNQLAEVHDYLINDLREVSFSNRSRYFAPARVCERIPLVK